ncbi:MAG: hypothetical protein LUF87_07895 [Alistipes sp.]|nr:hypothetical protein [Alistipes sp.]
MAIHELIFSVSLVPLGFMVVSDLRSRTVNILWLGLFGVLILTAIWLQSGYLAGFINMAVNIAAGSMLLGCGIIYWRIRHGKWMRPVDNLIGMGDIIFIILVSGLFAPVRFLYFLLSAMVFSLAIWLLMKLTGDKDNTVPLVAGMGIMAAVWKIIEIVYK